MPEPTQQHVIVGISGGVDSAVAALLLKQQGYRVQGLFMKNWEEDDADGRCSAEEDLRDARQVCETLGIELHTRNFSAEYWDRVFRYFLREYEAGRTPNPDVLCNREIKFKVFLEHAMELGADRIATGHYARSDRSGGRFRLYKGKDPGKDQTYFLYTLGQHPLSRSLFPLGGLHKSEVRKLAQQAGFANSGKKDSTGICFIGERNFRQFLQRYLPAQPGEIQTADGRVIGRHQGLMYYTLGQRKGLGLGGIQGFPEEPWYVIGKNLENNVLLVGQGHDHPMLFHRALEAGQLHWTAEEPPRLPLRCAAKTRYRQAEQPCTVHATASDRLRVEFDQPQWAMTPGQSVVFYQGDECLGGGIIEEVVS
jgi:tRNA-specific 2-thiouridylase